MTNTVSNRLLEQRDRFDAWQRSYMYRTETGDLISSTPPVSQSGGLPSGWQPWLSLPDAEAHLVTFEHGVGLVVEYTAQRLPIGGAQPHYTTLVRLGTSKGVLVADMLETATATMVESLSAALVPFYDVSDPAEAAGVTLIGLGARASRVPEVFWGGGPREGAIARPCGHAFEVAAVSV